MSPDNQLTLWTGGCACGAARYTISGTPVSMLHCQCRQCQRDSGTGHQSHITFVGAETALSGTLSVWPSTGDDGTLKHRHFCPTCGNPVLLTFPAMPDVAIITPASLDDPGRFRPTTVTWTRAGQDWDALDPVLTRFERMPG